MATDVNASLQTLENQISQVVLGKPDVIRMVLIALLAEGHILLEDVPGVGKTLIGKALAKSVGGIFSRIQFTPDLLPGDILGSSTYDAKDSKFEFHKGPLFGNVILADEINRTTPRTQSSLLEAMSEQQVSIDGQTLALSGPFIVIATQNPFEFEGTYPLPESQLDRFLIRTSVGYPMRESEMAILQSHRAGEPVDSLESCISLEEVLALQNQVREIAVDDLINEYLLNIADATRNSEELQVGVSTRGVLAWYRAAQALAMMNSREYVIPDDIKELAVPVLGHRVISKSYYHVGQRENVEAVIRQIVESIPVPV